MFKTAFITLALALAAAASFAAPAPDLNDNASRLAPDGWRLYKDVLQFTPDSLYEQIDGRAEFYLAYNFVRLTYALFEDPADTKRSIELSIYEMDSPINAFGVYSAEKSPGDSLDIGRAAYRSGSNVYVWKGRYYIQAIASPPTVDLHEQAIEAARKAADLMQDSGDPVWGLTTLPEQDRVPDSLRYFQVDAMGLDFMRDTFTAQYAKDGATIDVFVSRRDTPDAARAVMAEYAAYASKYGKGSQEITRGGDVFLVCDMNGVYDAVFTSGPLLAGVTAAKDRDKAVESAAAFKSALAAQASKTIPATIDPNLNLLGDNFLNRQSQALLDVVQETITRIPPQYPEPNERRLALLLMDGVVHDVYAASRQPLQDFFHQRIQHALNELESGPVKQGADIWKLYNMGFIVRTPTITIAFDLVDGASAEAPGFTLPRDITDRLIAQCDALFLSHRHGDHIDDTIAQKFLDQGKPVVAPPQIWRDTPIYDRITHLNREAHVVQALKIQNGTRDLQVVIYPGHQGKGIECNNSLIISPEGISFCHTGDQINEGDFLDDYKWIDEVRQHQKVDIFIPNCWTNELYRIVQGFDPKVVLPGHENELGHPIDDRVPYWGDSEYLNLTYPDLLKSKYPVIVMTWGEKYHYNE